MKNARQAITFLIVLLVSGTPAVTSAEEPVGLLLRKGTVAWKSSLQQARNFIEEDMPAYDLWSDESPTKRRS